jgi:hypothetical protein
VKTLGSEHDDQCSNLAQVIVAADRARSNEQLGRVIENVAFLSPRLLVPSSLAALVFGAIAAYLAWNLSYLWILLGLAGFAATFATGILVAAPRAAALAKVSRRKATVMPWLPARGSCSLS